MIGGRSRDLQAFACTVIVSNNREMFRGPIHLCSFPLHANIKLLTLISIFSHINIFVSLKRNIVLCICCSCERDSKSIIHVEKIIKINHTRSRKQKKNLKKKTTNKSSNKLPKFTEILKFVFTFYKKSLSECLLLDIVCPIIQLGVQRN